MSQQELRSFPAQDPPRLPKNYGQVQRVTVIPERPQQDIGRFTGNGTSSNRNISDRHNQALPHQLTFPLSVTEGRALKIIPNVIIVRQSLVQCVSLEINVLEHGFVWCVQLVTVHEVCVLLWYSSPGCVQTVTTFSCSGGSSYTGNGLMTITTAILHLPTVKCRREYTPDRKNISDQWQRMKCNAYEKLTTRILDLVCSGPINSRPPEIWSQLVAESASDTAQE